MHQHIQGLSIQPRLGRSLRLHDLLDGLELAEMIAAADAAKRGLEARRCKAGFG
jgi:hypothetical protein